MNNSNNTTLKLTTKSNDFTPLDHITQPGVSVVLMNSYFDFVYAQALLGMKNTVIRKNCFGCITDHPSQSQHDCIMNDFIYDDEHAIEFYFEEMLQEVDEEKILLSWEDFVRGHNISSSVIDLHKKVISSKDYLTVMKTDSWKHKMIKTMNTIVHVERRLFN